MKRVENEYDIGNRLIRSGEKTYSYDDDGNQIQAGDTSFDYMTSHVNGNNVKRLKSVYKNTDHVASYSYTLEGLRTGKYLNSGESEISFHYSGKNVIYEQWSSGRTVRYTHPSTGSSSCSSCGGCGDNANVFTDHPISIEIDGTKYYYLYNGQGSVTELINSDEEVVNQYRYTPFGSLRLKVESVYNPYQYTGRRLDKETGQYYYRARMYSASQSRFTTQDPAGMTEGPNMYAYVGNNPVNKRDPSGLAAEPTMIDGSPSATPCPDSFWEAYEYCVNHYRETFGELSAKEICNNICFDETISQDSFFDCMGIEGNLEAVFCFVALAAIGATGPTAPPLSVAILTGISAGGACGFTAASIRDCV